jgi:hypothetical protein
MKLIPTILICLLMTTACTTLVIHKTEPQTGDVMGANELSATKMAEKFDKANKIKAKYQLEGTTLKRTIKNDPKDRIEVEIGNTKLGAGEAEFSPDLTIARWDKEVSLTLSPTALDSVDAKDKSASFEDEKIIFDTPGVKYNLYEMSISDNLPEGGYEYEVVLKAKPKSNVVSFTINTKGLDFYYQPPLNEEKQEEEVDYCTATDCYNKDKEVVVHRPENVVGSYVVLTGKRGDFSRAVGGKNYKAGKVGHIYRPKIIDAKGNTIWGDLKIDKDNGLLNITIDRKWLDNAVYPVIVDPTFGNTTVGATSGSFAENTVRGYGPWTPTENGTINAVIHYFGADGGSASVRAVVYASSTLARVTYGYQTTLTTTDDWFEMPATSTSITAGTYYLLGEWLGTEGTGFSMYYDTGAGGNHRDNTAYHATNAPPDPFTDAATNYNRNHSVYARYACITGTCVEAYSTAGTYTWTAPTGVTSVNVACWGGGGSGDDGNGLDKGGGGGGGGAYAASTSVAVTAGNSYTVVVGAGGPETSYSAGTPIAGEDSSFNTTTIVAKGGGINDTNPNGGTGGQASASTGTTKYNGGNGGTAASVDNGGGGGGGGAGGPDGAGVNGNNASGTTSGTGGAGDNGSGGAGGGIATNGSDSTSGGGGGGGAGEGASQGGDGGSYGGGGGGGKEFNSGGAGSDGACVLTYTIGGAASSTAATPNNDIIIFE